MKPLTFHTACSRRSVRNPIGCFDQAAAIAEKSFFLRRRAAKKPKPASPASIMVQVGGKGVLLTFAAKLNESDAVN